jgi:hypothetical protein
MSRVLLGVLSGAIFGAFAVATMIPLKMEDKRRAMAGAFLHRFGIGFIICNITLPWQGWTNGLVVGLLLSIPEAIITKAWPPILTIGAIGGAVIGFLVG